MWLKCNRRIGKERNWIGNLRMEQQHVCYGSLGFTVCINQYKLFRELQLQVLLCLLSLFLTIVLSSVLIWSYFICAGMSDPDLTVFRFQCARFYDKGDVKLAACYRSHTLIFYFLKFVEWASGFGQTSATSVSRSAPPGHQCCVVCCIY
jgi:hypothetical protein